MGPFALVEGDEGELTGLMTGPAVLELERDGVDLDARQIMGRQDLSRRLALDADVPEQTDHGGQGAGQHQYPHHDAQELSPIGETGQHHRMDHQGQVHDGQPAVGREKVTVGEALDQGEGDQDHRGAFRTPLPNPHPPGEGSKGTSGSR